MDDKTAAHRRKAWDDAMLALLVERPALAGKPLLTAVITEANDAITRLKERGLLNPPHNEG